MPISSSNSKNTRPSYAVHNITDHSFKSEILTNEPNSLAPNYNKISNQVSIMNEDRASLKRIKPSDSHYENLNQFNCQSSVVNLNYMNDKENREHTDSRLKGKKEKRKPRENKYSRKSNAREKLEYKNKLLERKLLTADWALFFGLTGFILKENSTDSLI